MSTNGSQGSADHEQLQTLAKRHLLMHFTRHAAYEHERGAGDRARRAAATLYDTNGKRYFDGLSGLFCTQIGYSFGEELGEAAREQMAELPFYTNWSYAHPRSIELAAKVAELAPGDLNRVFFVSGGSEANESIIKLVKQYHQLHGHRRRYKMIARRIAYHGTTLGALSLTGIAPLRDAVRAADAGRPPRRRTRTATGGPRARPRQEFTAAPARRAARRDRAGGPRVGRRRVHGAGPELGRHVHAARGLLPGRPRRSATSTASCWSPTR